MESDLALEKEHFKHHRDVELEELRVSLAGLGLRDKLLDDCVAQIGGNDETLLKFMMSFEFGHTELDERSPLVAMLVSGCLFITGALPSVIPYICTSNVTHATIAAGCLASATLFAVGALKVRASARSRFCSHHYLYSRRAALVCSRHRIALTLTTSDMVLQCFNFFLSQHDLCASASTPRATGCGAAPRICCSASPVPPWHSA